MLHTDWTCGRKKSLELALLSKEAYYSETYGLRTKTYPLN